MSKPPPDDLKDWSKNELVRELRRVRAILREHAERPGDDPRGRSSAGSIIDVSGDPYAVGGALLDARSAVLLDGMEVVLVDTKRDEAVSMMMALRGRVNYSPDRVEHAYLFGPGGAAALVTEVSALAARAKAVGGEHGQRFASEFESEFQRRLGELP